MYSESRRYRKNDWWDLIVVFDQQIEKDKSYETYFYIADELKWRIVDSVSEGANFKIRNKAKEILESFKLNCIDYDHLSEVQRNDINSLFDIILTSKNENF